MTRRIAVLIPEPVAEKLTELAHREMRGTREQAAILLIAAIERAVRDSDRKREAVAR